VNRLLQYYGENSRGIVWAHNTHVGDARATAMAIRSEVNIGQLARERHGNEHVYILGFGTGTGMVLAGSTWGSPVQTMRIPHPPSHTLEGRLLAMDAGDRFWQFKDSTIPAPSIDLPHRAVGVIYNPAVEHRGNFVPTRLAQRYDAFIFLESTEPLNPLH
jgi:erythromycin esterase